MLSAPKLTTAQIDELPSPLAGDLVYNTDKDYFQIGDGSNFDKYISHSTNGFSAIFGLNLGDDENNFNTTIEWLYRKQIAINQWTVMGMIWWNSKGDATGDIYLKLPINITFMSALHLIFSEGITLNNQLCFRHENETNKVYLWNCGGSTSDELTASDLSSSGKLHFGGFLMEHTTS